MGREISSLTTALLSCLSAGPNGSRTRIGSRPRDQTEGRHRAVLPSADANASYPFSSLACAAETTLDGVVAESMRFQMLTMDGGVHCDRKASASGNGSNTRTASPTSDGLLACSTPTLEILAAVSILPNILT